MTAGVCCFGRGCGCVLLHSIDMAIKYFKTPTQACLCARVCCRDAVAAYTEAARLDPRTPIYLSNRALAYLRLFR
jgi:hypothetical protein